jgi:hypothetical protein
MVTGRPRSAACPARPVIARLFRRIPRGIVIHLLIRTYYPRRMSGRKNEKASYDDDSADRGDKETLLERSRDHLNHNPKIGCA